MSYEVERLREVKRPLAFYGLVVLVVEAAIAVLATVAFTDDQLRYKLYLWLIAALLIVVVIVSVIVIRYPRHLLGEFETALSTIVQQLSPLDRDTLLRVAKAGEIEYQAEDRNKYKDLRNAGLLRTSNRRAMRHDNRLVLTPLGDLVARELRQAT